METCAFTYDGGTNLSVTVTGASNGVTYRMFSSDSNSSAVSTVAAGGVAVINIINVGGDFAGYRFRARVQRLDNNTYVGVSGFAEGYPGEAGAQQVWTTDGADPPTVTLTFPSVLGVNYQLRVLSDVGQTVNAAVGTGADLLISVVGDAGISGGYIGQLKNDDTGEDLISRLFVAGVAGAGSPGNPVLSPTAAQVIVTLDGTDVTSFALTGSWTRRLNRPSTAQIRCPMENVSAAVGVPLKIEALINGSYQIVHHGRVLLCETDTAEDGGYTVYNSTDPMELWQWRPVRDNDCDFTKPNIIDSYTTGPLIIEAALQNSIYCGDGSQADCEGDLFLDIGTFPGGGVDLTGAPTDWPQTIAELFALLVSTGELDVVITPTDPGGGVMGTVDGYNGNYGTDRSADIVFSYGMGDFNVRRLRWNQDMTNMANKIWYYGGPRIATAADPAGDQHWCFNVTGDDPVLAFPPGGKLSPPASATNNQLGVLRVTSESTYGVRMDIQIFDAYDECAGVGAVGRDLFRRRWQQESWLRAVPREIIHVTPTRETQIGTFDVGDLVGVEAVSAVRGGFTGAQRVYEYTVSWDNDGVLELSELQTSADNEGL